MDNSREKLLLLGKIHEGKLSRNRDFQLFKGSSARRAHVAHNRLCALMRELKEPGARVSLGRTPESASLTIRVERLGFSHTARLTRWESEFFLENMGAKALLPL
ncbi:hypothetical protein EPN96_01965 [bacterium]|nr:MAG: hypothetical protein EPN96_01965 [bacterium]